MNMVQDALSSNQLIGMILPRDGSQEPGLFDVGCAGRISQYKEAQDGRLEIVLTGLCRYRVREELSTIRGYRLVLPDWSLYENDYAPAKKPNTDAILAFNTTVGIYLRKYEIDADLHILNKLGIEGLIHTLLNYLPLSNDDKQILIETETLEQRTTAFTAILENAIHPSATTH